jgi:hypothetical protein
MEFVDRQDSRQLRKKGLYPWSYCCGVIVLLADCGVRKYIRQPTSSYFQVSGFNVNSDRQCTDTELGKYSACRLPLQAVNQLNATESSNKS